MGSLPIITDNKLHSHPETEHQVKYYTNPANNPLSVCLSVSAYMYVWVLTLGKALTNGADNETSPLIKRSYTEQHTVVRHWTHTHLNTRRAHTRTGEDNDTEQWSMNETETWSKQSHVKQVIYSHLYIVCIWGSVVYVWIPWCRIH